MCLIASPIVVQREAFGQSRTVTFSQSPVRVRGELFFTTPFISHAPSETLSGRLRVTSRSASADGEMSEYDLLPAVKNSAALFLFLARRRQRHAPISASQCFRRNLRSLT